MKRGDRRGVRPDLVAKIEDILHVVEQARHIDQVARFPGWKVHSLKGARRGFWSIWVTANYRLTFRVEEEAVSYIDLEDYHGK